jgi:hypothetical protein
VDMIWLMLAFASLSIAYMLATFKKYRSQLEKVLGAIGHFSEENVKQQEELSRQIMAKEDDMRKVEDVKKEIEVNKGRIGEFEDHIQNSKKVQESLVIKTQSWKLGK